jgi:hypothetical protein
MNNAYAQGSVEPTASLSGRRGKYFSKFVTCKIPGQEDNDSPLQPARFPETSWVGKDFVQSNAFYTNSSYTDKPNDQSTKYHIKNEMNR